MRFAERWRATRADIAAEYHRLYDDAPPIAEAVTSLCAAFSVVGLVLAICIMVRG